MDKYSKADEETLIECSINGEQLAFKELVERHQGAIARVVKGVLGDCTEAEDVGQEVFIRFYKKMEQFNKKSSLKTYLTRIAINLSINEIKKQKRFLEPERKEDLINQKPDNQNIIKKMEDKEILDKALLQLSIENRSVVVLRLIQGYSTKETAELLKIPQGTVLSRLSRAQKKLQDILKPIMLFTL